MIKKYNDFLNEKLSDKLSGFNEVELRNEFINGKLSPLKFDKICKQYNLKEPTSDEIYKHIINYSDDINIILMYASDYNNLDAIKYAIDNGADIKYDNEYALHNSVNYGNLKTFEYIINQYDNVNISKGILYSILFNKNAYGMLKFLIEKGLDVDTKFNDSQTLLTTVIPKNKYDLVELLVDNDADIHYGNDKALYYAVLGNNYHITEYLLEHGATVYEYMFENTEIYFITKLLKDYYKKQTGKDFDENKKSKKILNEKLSDKLSGFNEEELKKQLLNGKIDIFKYLSLCEKYNIKITDESLIKKEYEKYSLEDILYKSFTVNSKFAIDYVYNNNVSDKIIIDVINYATLFYNDNMKVFILYLISKCKDNETVKNKILSMLPLNKFIIFKLLIDNFNFTKNELNNLLINVCRYNSNENLKIEYLIENGADIHYENERALSSAIFYDVYDNVECLLKNGAIVTDDIFNNAISDKNLSMNIKKILIKYYEK